MSGIYFENQVDSMGPDDSAAALREFYVPGSNYGFTITIPSNVLDDYFVAWRSWIVTSGGDTKQSNKNTSSTLLGTILGINNINIQLREDDPQGTLDCIIVRKSDRKAVRIVTTHESWDDVTYTDVSNNANYPELQRLRLLGII